MPAKTERGKYDPEETRRRLMEAAFCEIHRHGFRSAGMDRILTRAGVTKGALYHHFGSKIELGYAVVKEMVPAMIQQEWGDLEHADDPVGLLIEVLEQKEFCAEEIELGCPLNNLANEMAPIDDRFRLLIEEIFQGWRDRFAQALKTSQERGYIRADIPTVKAAAFLVGALEGGASQVKSARNPELMRHILDMAAQYLKDLRPQTVEVT